MSDPKVSVVSVTHNRRDNVSELLQSLKRQTYKDFEVILIDNNSNDGTCDVVEKDFPEVQIIRNDHNLGMVAYNLGFKVAQGDYILVIDDDGLPGSDEWIQLVVDSFESNPKLGAVSCTIRMRDTGIIAHDSPQFVPENQILGGYPGIAFNGTGAGLRSRALEDTGFYPSSYSIMYLELYLCTALMAHGWEVRHFPNIEVWHSRPSGSSYPARSISGLRNYYWYVWKFYPWPDVMLETLHEAAYRSKLVFNGDLSLKNCLSASIKATTALPGTLGERSPISADLLNYIQSVRKQGNWHGIVPKQRNFDGEQN